MRRRDRKDPNGGIPDPGPPGAPPAAAAIRAASGSNTNASMAPQTAKAANTPPNVVQTTDWNATEVQIRQLTVGGHDLTSRIDRLWDDTSAPISSVNQLGQPLAEKPHLISKLGIRVQGLCEPVCQ